MQRRLIAAAGLLAACCCVRAVIAQQFFEAGPSPAPAQNVFVPLPPVTETRELVSPELVPPPALELHAELPFETPRSFGVQPVSAVEVVPQTEMPPPPQADPDAYPINLATAVHLAGSESLAVALAREQCLRMPSRVSKVRFNPSKSG